MMSRSPMHTFDDHPLNTNPFYSHLNDFFIKHLIDNDINFTCDGETFCGLDKAIDINILIGLSGGLDSVVLLDMLYQFKKTQDASPTLGTSSVPVYIQKIKAIYVHHGLSANADSWASHCQVLCKHLGIELIIERVKVSAKGMGIEAGAREARYQAFKRHLENNDILMTAQHLDDQAETFLLALKRGSGINGLSAMAACQMLDSGHRQLRPLLNFTRKELEHYANQNQLSWIEDESNLDTHYDRNFLRLEIMPHLEKRWPSFNKAVAKSAELCGSDARLLDELLSPLLSSVSCPQEKTLSITPLTSWSNEKRQAIIKKWCEQYTLMSISREQLRRIWEEVALSREDAQGIVELGLCHNKQHLLHVRRYQNKLYLVEYKASQLPLMQELASKTRAFISKKEPLLLLPWQNAPLTFQEIKLFLEEKLHHTLKHQHDINLYLDKLDSAVLQVRFNLVNSLKIEVIGTTKRKTLKHIFQESGVPPWKRPFVPMVFLEDELLLGLGVFVTKLS